MRKVVYNACFGGFSLSPEAVKRAREISGNPNWADATLAGEIYSDGSGPRDSYSSGCSIHIDFDFPRHDEVLVRVVEELGALASGQMARLEIAQVNGPYRIDEYDGNETVMTPDDYEWS